MQLISHILALEYTGTRLRQLRADPIRRNHRFLPWGDYLLDDLNHLRIPILEYVVRSEIVSAVVHQIWTISGYHSSSWGEWVNMGKKVYS